MFNTFRTLLSTVTVLLPYIEPNSEPCFNDIMTKKVCKIRYINTILMKRHKRCNTQVTCIYNLKNILINSTQALMNTQYCKLELHDTRPYLPYMKAFPSEKKHPWQCLQSPEVSRLSRDHPLESIETPKTVLNSS